MSSSIGFDSLPGQYMNRVKMNGLAFNVLVVGPTGIGKTTLINSLFDYNYPDTSTCDHNAPSVELNINTLPKPTDASMHLKVTIIETKGFNDQLDKTSSHRKIVDYIDAQFEKFLQEELKVQRNKYTQSQDTRVHCCIYMLPPSGHGLKAIDLQTMKELHERVCLIPVIAKSDVLTKLERKEFKDKIMREILLHNIQIYQPVLESSEKCDIPFAVSASDDFSTTKEGIKLRARKYPWGQHFIETHSDFGKLRNLVLKDNMLTLVHQTNQVHYEKYRQEATSEDMSLREHRRLKEEYLLERRKLEKQIAKLEDESYKLSSMNALASSAYSN